MYKTTKTISFTPEGTAAATGSVFAFQDNEADVQAEFERHVQFALDLARSAPDPTHPESHLTASTRPNFVVDKFNVSYGSPQTVQVNARRDLGPVPAHWQVNGGTTHTVNQPVDRRPALRRRGRLLVPPHARPGRRQRPGDDVKVWFSAPTRTRERSFTYNVRSNSGADVLVLAVEDYTGQSALPAYNQTKKPNYLSYYTNALERQRRRRTTSTTSTRWSRMAPDPLGVLSHYDAVLWETGNDNVTRNTATPGVSDAEAWETIMSVRDFVNEGGRFGVGRERRAAVGSRGVPDRGARELHLRRQSPDDRRRASQPAVQRFRPVLPRGVSAFRRGRPGRRREYLPGGRYARRSVRGAYVPAERPEQREEPSGDGLGTGNFLVTSSVLPKSSTRSSRATRRPTGSCRAARRSIRTRDRSTCTPRTRTRGTSASPGRST